MTRTIFAALILLSLAACQRNASDEPESTADTTPAAATTPDTTATATPPASDTTASTTDMTTDGTSTMGTTDSGAMGTDPTGASDTAGTAGTTGDMGTGMGSTATGQSDATLDADLRRCDTMSGSERTTCRSEAQSRYETRAGAGDDGMQ